MQTRTAALIAVSAVIGATVMGGRYGPGPHRPGTTAWYAALRKPRWTPSGATIGTMWTIVDGFLAFSGTRVLRAPPGPQRQLALTLWGFNVASIWGWQRVFFGNRALGPSVAYVAAMVGSGLGYVAAARRVDGMAAASGLAYPAWVSVAGVLTEQIWRRNRNVNIDNVIPR
jgi:tryptophan-rich sensory protein